MSVRFGLNYNTKRQIVVILTCVILVCIIFVILDTQGGKRGILYELIKPANILGYIKALLYLRCLTFLRTNGAQNKVAMFVIIFTWCIGDIIDAIDGPLARYTLTDSNFGEKLDHRVFDVFRKPFMWLVLTILYPEFTVFWQILLFRMFIREDEKFQIPRVPILPFINVAWYFPVIVVFSKFQDTIITKLIEGYLACVFLTWGLEGDPPKELRLDWYAQCYILRQSDRCDLITKMANKTTY